MNSPAVDFMLCESDWMIEERMKVARRRVIVVHFLAWPTYKLVAIFY